MLHTRRGVCIWLTGIPCTGKSTTARALATLLSTRDPIVLDGDVVRTHLSGDLGFSKADRDTNVRRLGIVAAELVRSGSVVIVAAVSPYRAARDDVRQLIGPDQFFEVFVDTPVEICERRDVKGMYARARRGELQSFTGVNDPYEPPQTPAMRLDTVSYSADENARLIEGCLQALGFFIDGTPTSPPQSPFV